MTIQKPSTQCHIQCRGLIAKLQEYGIKGKVNAWISDFLIGQKQQVTVEDAESDWTNVVSGVPQGSVLGAILFVICINDLVENIPQKSRCLQITPKYSGT